MKIKLRRNRFALRNENVIKLPGKPRPLSKKRSTRDRDQEGREEREERERRAIADMGDRVHGSEKKPLASLRLKALAHAARMPSPDRETTSPPTLGASNWTQLGPLAIPNGQTYGGARVLVAGRVTAIMIDPTNSNTIYIGSANAGVWKTTDGGANWTSKSDFEASLAIGALAMDPVNHLRIYAGTGEGNLTYYKTFLNLVQDSYYGSGLLRSSDGGNTWTRLGGTEFTGHSFFRIAINPSDQNTIFAATSNGLFLSKDAGGTWSLLSNGLPAISSTILGASDVVIDSSNPAVVYAAFWEDGIYKTSNGNTANPLWTKLAGGLPNPTPSRVGLGISASSPQRLYAGFGNSLFMTTNGGTTWSSITVPAGVSLDVYGNNIAVDPTTPDIIYLSCYPSLWKGTRDSMTGVWTFTEIGLPIHPDNHAFAFDPANHLAVYAANDGGIYKSLDGGSTWTDGINRTLTLTQFEFIDQHPTSDAVVFGGTQDNGTEQFRNSPVFSHADDGDGGYVAVDPAQPRNVLHVYYNRSLARSTIGGKFGSWSNVAGGLAGSPLFYPPFTLDQTNSNNIVYGTDRVNLDTTQGTGGWATKVALPGISGRISALAYVNSNLIYAGTTTGQVYRLSLAAGVWTPTAIHAAPLPGLFIWDLATLPGDPNTIIVVFSGFGSDHVWRGTVPVTGPAAWASISGSAASALPDVPVYALVIDPSNSALFCVGTDIGVFRTIDSGATWTPFSSGLPTSPVFDLKLHAATRLLRAGTHGRGIWERPLDGSIASDQAIFVRDNLMDTGRFSPSPAWGSVFAAFEDPLHYVSLGDPVGFWQCADIKIDALEGASPSFQMNTADVDYLAFESRLQHRNPQRGNVNRVYVQAHNRGIAAAANVRVKILYADASAGLPPLPADFWTAFPGDSVDTSVWHPIGSATVIPSLSPTAPAILEWDWMPPLSAADHSCMLVVTDSLDDPIPAANKVFDVGTMVNNERHVGLKNLHVVNIPPGAIWPTAFSLAARSKLLQELRFLPASGSGWKLGIFFPIETQRELKLKGLKMTKPSATLLQPIREKFGPLAEKFDLQRMYQVGDVGREAVITGIRLVKGRLKTLLVFQAPAKVMQPVTMNLVQASGHKIVGGSTFTLRTVKQKR